DSDAEMLIEGFKQFVLLPGVPDRVVAQICVALWDRYSSGKGAPRELYKGIVDALALRSWSEDLKPAWYRLLTKPDRNEMESLETALRALCKVSGVPDKFLAQRFLSAFEESYHFRMQRNGSRFGEPDHFESRDVDLSHTTLLYPYIRPVALEMLQVRPWSPAIQKIWKSILRKDAQGNDSDALPVLSQAPGLPVPFFEE